MPPVPPTLQAFESVFQHAVFYLLAVAGVLVFFTFIIGGFKYLTSGGDPKAVQAAHSTLTYAVLGLIFTVLAFIFLLIISYVTGNTSILNFVIYQP
jgi:hypothetical protein